MKMKHSQTGLTLIELMVTMAIIGILSAVAVPGYNAYKNSSSKTECYNETAAIRLAQEDFIIQNSTYFQGIGIVAIMNNSLGSYIPSYGATAAAIAAAAPNCAFSITAGSTGNIATSYSLTISGIGSLAGIYVTQTVGN